MFRLFLILSLVLNALFTIFFVQSKTKPQNFFTVSRIVDGDTFVIDNQQKGLPAVRQVRLMSVNTPEITLCGGPEAKSVLEKLLKKGQKVKLVGDINDHYGRLLALVYLPDGTLINESLIRSGWARFTSTASPESSRLQTAFQQTKAAKIGVFSSLCYQQTNPVNPSCNIKGNVKDGKKTYFFPGCGNYSNVALELDQGDQWFCTEAEAAASGFTKADNCHNKTYSNSSRSKTISP